MCHANGRHVHSFHKKTDFRTEIPGYDSYFLRGEPCAVGLAWWYIGSRLSIVCVCGCGTVVKCSLLTSVIILVSLCDPDAGKTTSPSLPTCHAEKEAEP